MKKLTSLNRTADVKLLNHHARKLTGIVLKTG